MDEVRQRGPEPAEHARYADRHAELLRARTQDDRLDAVRHERGIARERSDAKVGCRLRQCAQELLDVRLVARPVTAEHVGVDEHERLRHETACR